MTDRKAVVKNADMSEDMQQEAVDVATQVQTLDARICPHPHDVPSPLIAGYGEIQH